MFAKIICLEGPDSCGKSTQATLLLDHYSNQGLTTSLVKVPYNDRVTHKLIYTMLADGRAKRHPTWFQFIQLVNKLIFQFFVLPFLFVRNDIIILDRWTLSARVYGIASGAHRFVTHTLNRLLFTPTVTVLLTKKHKRNTQDDSYEADVELQNRVRNQYLLYAACRNDIIYVPRHADMGSAQEVSLWLVYQLWLHNVPTAPKVENCHCEESSSKLGLMLKLDSDPPIKPWRNESMNSIQ